MKLRNIAHPKTPGQKRYLSDIDQNTITICVGPAGTGKSYLAVAKALEALVKKEVRKIILTRPAIEAGERLGFLPGDLMNKIDPYLRPLYDSLGMLLEAKSLALLLEDQTIEVAPLAYMRGRTLNDAIIILDEAQNTTNEQMKMFLTRLGENSKMIITGDLTQTDLYNRTSGLLTATRILSKISGLKITRLTTDDVVRHEIVGKIINAYSNSEKNQS
jgi:phosphate starvation-inducible PhoH-like protein